MNEQGKGSDLTVVLANGFTDHILDHATDALYLVGYIELIREQYGEQAARVCLMAAVVTLGKRLADSVGGTE